ncbi:hypothetical protein LPJ59_007155, partial [Coemansia sp. RSA 2399]
PRRCQQETARIQKPTPEKLSAWTISPSSKPQKRAPTSHQCQPWPSTRSLLDCPPGAGETKHGSAGWHCREDRQGPRRMGNSYRRGGQRPRSRPCEDGRDQGVIQGE